MTLEYQVGRIINRVESKDLYELIRSSSINCCEILASITELDLFTCLKWYYFSEVLYLVVMVADVH